MKKIFKKNIYYRQVVHLHSKDLVRDDIVGKECPFPLHKVEKIQSRDPAKSKINFNKRGQIFASNHNSNMSTLWNSSNSVKSTAFDKNCIK